MGRASGINRSESATDGGGESAALGMITGKAARNRKRPLDKNENRAPVAAGDDYDVAIDRGSAKDGEMDARSEPAFPSEDPSL